MSYPAQTVLNFLRGSTTRDMSLLAKQAIVARLNLAAGADSIRAETLRLLDQADALFAEHSFHANAPAQVADEVAELTAE